MKASSVGQAPLRVAEKARNESWSHYDFPAVLLWQAVLSGQVQRGEARTRATHPRTRKTVAEEQDP